MTSSQLNDLSYAVIGAAIEVHRVLGPGLLEDIYRDALVYELRLRGINAVAEVDVPVIYKGITLQSDKRVDILVEDELVLELKSVREMKEKFHKQILSYMRLLNKRLGLLINFNESVLRDGIYRKVNGLQEQ